MIRALFGAGAVALALLLSVGACSDDARDLFIASNDAGPDAAVDATVDAGAATIDLTLGGPCNDDAQCDDTIACTHDACDKSLSRCRNTPDDNLCQDNVYCNGQERCVLRQGCVAGAVVTCQDDNACTIDHCIEATKSCDHVPRDADGDGDPDDHCVPHHDCDDNDPTVSSLRQEICNNFKDDNCNGLVDEQPCSVPANDTCATAQAVTASGSFLLTTVATKQDYTTSCSTSITGAQDIVLAITVPAGGAQDILVNVAAENSSANVAITLETACGGNVSSEIQCQAQPAQSTQRAIARSVAGGTTVYAIVTTSRETAVDVNVSYLPPTVHPTNETCDTPTAVGLDTPFAFSLIDAQPDVSFPNKCIAITTPRAGDLTYSFKLDTPRDVRIYASTTLGTAAPIISLTDPACTVDTAKCRVGATAPLYVRAMPAGTYVLSVTATAQIDGNVLIATAAPTTAPADQSCATAPTLVPNQTFKVDLSNHDGSIDDGCFETSATAARTLALDVTSDVLVIGRFPTNETGGISLDTPTCTLKDQIGCQTGAAPLRINQRAMAPGSYRLVVADQLSQVPEVSVLTRPTVSATPVGTADACQDAFLIPPTGGFFTGDTTNATADFDAVCDAPGQPALGAKDQLLKLVLTKPQRVVFDMFGSDLATILDIRTGEPCPGFEVQNACNQAPSYDPLRSFLDITLGAATYYVQIDGYAGAVGKWNLDVRILDPDPPPPTQ
jgi:hypothetical protein